jgi:signal transduction histidine kinase
LAVEHDIIPLNGADVFQQGEINSIGDRVALTKDPGDFARLPVDDARQDQVQAAAGVHLLPQLAGVDPAPPPVKDIPGQGVELLDFEQAAPDAAAPRVFTAKRLAMLELLASQAAISLDHARLYADFGRLNAELTQENSDRRKAEEELRQKEISLREAQTELAHVSRVTTMGELAASIAHEVKQPLAGIVTNANASLRWLASELPNLKEAREAIGRIIRDGNRANDVVTRMRALFKKAYTAKERFDINDAIGEVAILTQREARRNQVALRIEPAADLPTVTGDRVQLQQVVMNLILNGIEAMSTIEDRERDLVIRTQRGEGDEVRVAVQDSGIGFDPRSAERMFDAFHTTKPGGLGMGLSISRSIVESHGGRLWAVPNDGPGATFQFTFHT